MKSIHPSLYTWFHSQVNVEFSYLSVFERKFNREHATDMYNFISPTPFYHRLGFHLYILDIPLNRIALFCFCFVPTKLYTITFIWSTVVEWNSLLVHCTLLYLYFCYLIKELSSLILYLIVADLSVYGTVVVSDFRNTTDLFIIITTKTFQLYNSIYGVQYNTQTSY